MNDFNTDALVIRTLPSGDSDRLITLLTAGRGRINVMAKGARSLKSRYMPACAPFVYGNYEIRAKTAAEKGGGELCWLKEAQVSETFREIGRDIVKTYLAQYFCDVVYELTGPGAEATELLRLTLNSLHAVSRGLKPDLLIKAVFELRAAAAGGYEPDVSGCGMCGAECGDGAVLDVMNGRLICHRCMGKNGSADASDVDPLGTRILRVPLSAPALAAVRYALTAPEQRMLAFELRDPSDTAQFSRAAEIYLLSHLERGFSSLKCYHELRQ